MDQSEKLDELTSKLEKILEREPQLKKFWITMAISVGSIIATIIISFTSVKKDVDRALELAIDKNRHVNAQTIDNKIVSWKIFLTTKLNIKEDHQELCDEFADLKKRIRELEQN